MTLKISTAVSWAQFLKNNVEVIFTPLSGVSNNAKLMITYRGLTHEIVISIIDE